LSAIGDEAQYRKPTWRAGHNVVLADGQAWALPRPLMRFIPAETSIGFEACLTLAGDDGYNALVLAFEAAEDGPAIVGASLSLAKALLLSNYDLTPQQVGQIVQFGFNKDDDPDGFRMKEEAMAVALGQGPSLPKPSSAGESPAPTEADSSPSATG
jgi:hypothetical protein